ncbi:acetyltransferase [bacterium]|nr:acetyltransferase [bacterium]
MKKRVFQWQSLRETEIKMNSKLLIIGAGGHGKVVADAAKKMKVWDSIEFLDDLYPKIKFLDSWQIVGTKAEIHDFDRNLYSALVAIGDNQKRWKIVNDLKKINFPLATVIHPSAQIAEDVKIGKGSVIFANVVINFGAIVKEACIVNTAATIDHDCLLSNSVHISPGANLGGGVSVGELSWVGIGSCVIHNCTIGPNVKIGAGAAVISNVPGSCTFVGVPASQAI